MFLMDAVLSLFLLLAMAAVTDATWCVCRQDVGQAAQQKALDYACGAGADCGPIQQNGPCFQPNTVLAHCSYAVNSYYQRKGQVPGSCDFAGSATVSPSDPSVGTCSYPSTASAAGTPTGITPVVPGTPIIGGGVTSPPQFTPTNPPPTTTNPGLTPTNPGLTPTNPGLTPTNPGLTPTTPTPTLGGGGGAFTPGTTTGGGGVLGGGVGLGPSGVSSDGTGGAPALHTTLAAAAAGVLSVTVLAFLVQ